MDFSSDLLNTFIAVCESRTFSLATGKSYKSQPAVSIQIAKLESQLGVKLIDRSRRPLEPSEAGKIFLTFAREVMNKGDEVGRHLEELARGMAGEVKIGVTTSISTYLSSKLIKNTLAQLRRLKLYILAQPKSAICEAVQQSQVDFGVIISDSPPQNLRWKFLRKEPLCLVTSPKTPFARRRSVTPKELQSIPFISGVKGTEYMDMADTLLARSGIRKYSVAIRISNLEGRKEAAIAGLGLTILPYFAVSDELRKRTLTTITVRGIRLIEPSIMYVERFRYAPTPGAVLVRKIVETTIKDV